MQIAARIGVCGHCKVANKYLGAFAPSRWIPLALKHKIECSHQRHSSCSFASVYHAHSRCFPCTCCSVSYSNMRQTFNPVYCHFLRNKEHITSINIHGCYVVGFCFPQRPHSRRELNHKNFSCSFVHFVVTNIPTKFLLVSFPPENHTTCALRFAEGSSNSDKSVFRRRLECEGWTLDVRRLNDVRRETTG